MKLLAFLFTILLVSAFKVDSLLGVIRFSCHDFSSKRFKSFSFRLVRYQLRSEVAFNSLIIFSALDVPISV